MGTQKRQASSLRIQVFTQKCIYVKGGDVNILYLGLLKHYQNALSSRRRYLLVGPLLAFMAVYIFFDFDLPNFVHFMLTAHPDAIFRLIDITNKILISLIELGTVYCLGIMAWILYASGPGGCRKHLSIELSQLTQTAVVASRCSGTSVLA
jgi:hypothetical protein